MRFLGNIEAKTDAKGRVFFPAQFRKILQSCGEERLIMRGDVYQACLSIYPESVWNKQMDIMRKKLNRWDGRQQMIFRQFVTNVELLTIDGNGRFLIPGRYRKLAKIEANVSFVGLGDMIEIWNPADLANSMLSKEEFSNELGALMADYVEEE